MHYFVCSELHILSVLFNLYLSNVCESDELVCDVTPSSATWIISQHAFQHVGSLWASRNQWGHTKLERTCSLSNCDKCMSQNSVRHNDKNVLKPSSCLRASKYTGASSPVALNVCTTHWSNNKNFKKEVAFFFLKYCLLNKICTGVKNRPS